MCKFNTFPCPVSDLLGLCINKRQKRSNQTILMMIPLSDDPNGPLQLELELFEVGEVLSRNGAAQILCIFLTGWISQISVRFGVHFGTKNGSKTCTETGPQGRRRGGGCGVSNWCQLEEGEDVVCPAGLGWLNESERELLFS